MIVIRIPLSICIFIYDQIELGLISVFVGPWRSH